MQHLLGHRAPFAVPTVHCQLSIVTAFLMRGWSLLIWVLYGCDKGKINNPFSTPFQQPSLRHIILDTFCIGRDLNVKVCLTYGILTLPTPPLGLTDYFFDTLPLSRKSHRDTSKRESHLRWSTRVEISSVRNAVLEKHAGGKGAIFKCKYRSATGGVKMVMSNSKRSKFYPSFSFPF